MWTYEQSTGILRDAKWGHVSSGYAGRGDGKNNPAMQHVKNVGPLPTGLYHIEKAITHQRLGPLSLLLMPDIGNVMLGRYGFYIHGDSLEAPGEASEGCIVLGRAARAVVNESNDRWLSVIP